MPRKEKSIHYLYKTTCLVTGRWYIGMHSTSNLDDGYMGSGTKLRRSIRKYGESNHKKEILEFFDNRELLVEAEIKSITEDMVSDSNCMNLVLGGEGGFISLSGCTKGGYEFQKKYRGTKEQIEWSRKGAKIKLDKHGCDELNKFKYTNKGGTLSDEHRKKIGESRKGKGSGKNNSQYGTKWITNGIISKKIKKNEVVPDGWKFGYIRKRK